MNTKKTMVIFLFFFVVIFKYYLKIKMIKDLCCAMVKHVRSRTWGSGFDSRCGQCRYWPYWQTCVSIGHKLLYVSCFIECCPCTNLESVSKLNLKQSWRIYGEEMFSSCASNRHRTGKRTLEGLLTRWRRSIKNFMNSTDRLSSRNSFSIS